MDNTPDYAKFFPRIGYVVVFNKDGDILGAEIPAETHDQALAQLKANGYHPIPTESYTDVYDLFTLA